MKAKATQQATPRGLDPPQNDAKGEYRRMASNEYACRKRRSELVQLPLFGEPAWDILLWLYAHGEERKLSLARLAELAGAPLTTTARWLDYLVVEHLVTRVADRFDHRFSTLSVTEQAAAMMDRYFGQQRTGGQ